MIILHSVCIYWTTAYYIPALPWTPKSIQQPLLLEVLSACAFMISGCSQDLCHARVQWQGAGSQVAWLQWVLRPILGLGAPADALSWPGSTERVCGTHTVSGGISSLQPYSMRDLLIHPLKLTEILRLERQGTFTASRWDSRYWPSA